MHSQSRPEQGTKGNPRRTSDKTQHKRNTAHGADGLRKGIEPDKRASPKNRHSISQKTRLKASGKKARISREFEFEKHVKRTLFIKQATKRFLSQITTFSDENKVQTCSDIDF